MTTSEIDALKQQFAALALEVKTLRDIEDIKKVFFKWHHACTGGFNGKQAGRMEALECLTEDATIEIQGLHEPGKGPTGRDQYTTFWEFYYGDDGPLPYVFQTSVSDDIEVDGDRAVQKSNMLALIQPRGHKPWLGLSQRTNHLVRTPAGWRITKTTMEGGISVDVDDFKDNFTTMNRPVAYRERPEWKYGE
jgi:hypothetical protein